MKSQLKTLHGTALLRSEQKNLKGGYGLYEVYWCGINWTCYYREENCMEACGPDYPCHLRFSNECPPVDQPH
jgi:hypothetical protein